MPGGWCGLLVSPEFSQQYPAVRAGTVNLTYTGVPECVQQTCCLQQEWPESCDSTEAGHDLLLKGFVYASPRGFLTFSMKNPLSFCLLPLALVIDWALM